MELFSVIVLIILASNCRRDPCQLLAKMLNIGSQPDIALHYSRKGFVGIVYMRPRDLRYSTLLATLSRRVRP